MSIILSNRNYLSLQLNKKSFRLLCVYRVFGRTLSNQWWNIVELFGTFFRRVVKWYVSQSMWKSVQIRREIVEICLKSGGNHEKREVFDKNSPFKLSTVFTPPRSVTLSVTPSPG